MRIFVSAAEISSDQHAEKLLLAWKMAFPGESPEFYGIGGPRLRAIPGFRALARAEDLRSMGFVEILGRIRELQGIRDRVAGELRRHPPDLILTFDYPDFHFSLMRRLSAEPWYRAALKICGIPPKVWVWRRNRVEKIRALYDGVWVIFPFEKEFYEARGIPVIYEGNPGVAALFDRAVPKEPITGPEGVRLAVLPGSREGELDRHLPLVHPALNHLAGLLRMRVIAEVPVPEGVSAARIERELVSNDRVWYRFIANGAAEVLARNPIGLVKSGTASLEAAVLGCVPVIFYRLNPISEWIFRNLVRYRGPVGLPNILLGVRNRTRVEFPELLGDEAAPDRLAMELCKLVEDSGRLAALREKGESLRESLVPGRDVAGRSVLRMQEWLRARPAQPIERRRSFGIGMVSWLWSGVNRLRRAWAPCAPFLPLPSVLVGNLQAGGAGKTPFVIELAREAQRRGHRVGIVTRGYGGSYPEKVRVIARPEDPGVIGDEAAEMAHALPGIPIALSPDRRRAAQALREQGVEWVIADDGFQNLGFRSEVTVLLVTDARRNEVPYRDFDSAAAGSDFLVQTKGRAPDRFPRALPLDWEPEALPERPVWIWSAIGDPAELAHYYRKHGVTIQKTFFARDHAAPERQEIQSLMAEALREGAVLAVTPKDAVKIPPEILEHAFVLRRRLRRDPELQKLWDSLFGKLSERLQTKTGPQ